MSVQNITMKQVKELINTNSNISVLDVRTPSEFSQGNIPNSLNIDVMNMSVFKESLAALDPSKPYIVYCRSGGRSKLASSTMESKGFTQVYNATEGFAQWS